MRFYEKFIQLCNRDGLSPSGAAEAIGSTRASATRWKNNSRPSDATIQKLAELFHVPFDFFSEDEKTAAPKDDGLTNAQRKLLELIPLLTDSDVSVISATAQSLIASRKHQDSE